MNVSFARPNVSDLMFHLYERSVHPELFRVYAQSECRRRAFRAVISICDAGHVIGFRYRGQTITEITTSRQHSLPQRKRFLAKRLHGCRDEAFHFDCGIRYQASFQVEVLEPEVYLRFHEELLNDCEGAALSLRFPAGSRLSPGPLSLIQTDSSADSLLIHAFHTFPENCAIVKTQSLFEL